MKRVMCGKMVAYQNVEIGKGPGNVVYKVGQKGGPQCSDGAPKTSYKVPNVHNQNDSAAVWNIIALSMCLRSQSPDSNSCLVSPLSSPSLNSPSTTSLRTSPDGEKLLSPCSNTSSNTSSLYSGLGSSLSGGADLETRSSSLLESEDKLLGLALQRSESTQLSRGGSWSAAPSFSTDSSDEEKSTVSHFRDQFEGGVKFLKSYGAYPESSSSRLFVGLPHEPHLEGSDLSSSSSSIGGCDDSSCSSEEGSNESSSSGDMEVESAFRGGPLHHMSALEDSLPIKRGLSRFWNGKAKSFSSLAEVSSIQELAKPDNPYAKRRRVTTFGERHKSFPPLSHTSTAGISKRPTSTSGSRSGLAMAVAMGSKLEEAPKYRHSKPAAAPPLYPSRSMSLTDLVQATSKAV